MEAITMRSLASRMGLSPTALYLYFASKHALLRAARRRALDDLRARLEATLVTDDAQALGRWVLCYASGDHRDPWHYGLFPYGKMGDSAEVEEAATLVGLTSVERVLDSIRGRGELAPGISSPCGAWLIWSGAHSLLTLRSAVEHNCAADDEATLHALVGAVVHGVVPSSGPDPFRSKPQ